MVQTAQRPSRYTDPDELAAQPTPSAYDAVSDTGATPSYSDGATNLAAVQDVVETPTVAAADDAGSTSAEAPQNPRLARLAGGKGDTPPIQIAQNRGTPSPQAAPRGEADVGDPQVSKYDVGPATGPGGPPQAPQDTATGSSPAWKALAAKDAEIQRLKQSWSDPSQAFAGLFAGNVRGRQQQMQELQIERRELYQQAVYEDNRMGQRPSGPPQASFDNAGNPVWVQINRAGQRQIIGPRPPTQAEARIQQANTRAAALEAVQKAKKESRFSSGGKMWYVDPIKGVQPLGPEETVTPQGPQGPEAGGAPLPSTTTINQLPADAEKLPAGATHIVPNATTGDVSVIQVQGNQATLLKTFPKIGGTKPGPGSAAHVNAIANGYNRILQMDGPDAADDYLDGFGINREDLARAMGLLGGMKPGAGGGTGALAPKKPKVKKPTETATGGAAGLPKAGPNVNYVIDPATAKLVPNPDYAGQ
jgi:hypothetical protein